MTDDVAIDTIRLNGGTQLRVETDTAVVREYAEALARGVVFPPIRLVYDNAAACCWLVDGFHRLAAHKLAGRKFITADVEDGDLTLARLRACGANLDHGLRRSNETKRNVVREAISNPLTDGWSNQRIAELCGVSAPFVGSMREALGLTPAVVVGKNGKTYSVADKLTEAHIFACPSLAQVEDWCRQHSSSPLKDVLHRYRQHLVSIEQPTTLAALDLRWSYGLANAALKGSGVGSGVIKALALRIEALLHEAEAVGEARPSWEDDLAKADSVSASWVLAFDPAILRSQREQALLAWAQWSDSRCGWPREQAATPGLVARWDKTHAPPEVRQAPPPLTLERVSEMSREELEMIAPRWEVFDQRDLREAALTAAARVAPDLVVTCPDPLCGAGWLKANREWCPQCRAHVFEVPRMVQQQAARTDLRRKLAGSPLYLVLEVLARPTWGPEDEDLLWHRVAAWKAEGCEGLPPAEDERDDEDLDDEIDDEDLDDEDAA